MVFTEFALSRIQGQYTNETLLIQKYVKWIKQISLKTIYVIILFTNKYSKTYY